MLGKLIQLGVEYAPKSPLMFQHVCFIVKGKSILSVKVNVYGHNSESDHAEERALLHCVHPKYRECGQHLR